MGKHMYYIVHTQANVLCTCMDVNARKSHTSFTSSHSHTVQKLTLTLRHSFRQASMHIFKCRSETAESADIVMASSSSTHIISHSMFKNCHNNLSVCVCVCVFNFITVSETLLHFVFRSYREVR